MRLEAGGMSFVCCYFCAAVCPISVGVCGVSSDVVGYRVHRVRTSQVSPPRVSKHSSPPSFPVSAALTSHLNGEEGVASFMSAPIIGSSL
jgi:hypothetical protein